MSYLSGFGGSAEDAARTQLMVKWMTRGQLALTMVYDLWLMKVPIVYDTYNIL